MTQYSHQTAPTQFVEANGIRFAYRRFGKTGEVPLVFSQHYIGTMDYWDPVTDGLARNREVILFNNAGVSSSSGEVPTTFERMGADAIAFSLDRAALTMGTPQPTRHGLPHTNRLEAKTMLKDLNPHSNQEIRS
jgi:pimeloyl-ACP methyl ester carboxylesterase